jgi:hypothetical protein
LTPDKCIRLLSFWLLLNITSKNQNSFTPWSRKLFNHKICRSSVVVERVWVLGYASLEMSYLVETDIKVFKGNGQTASTPFPAHKTTRLLHILAYKCQIKQGLQRDSSKRALYIFLAGW